MTAKDIVRLLDEERSRLRLTKAQLARRGDLPHITVRQIFSTDDPDPKLSTVLKLLAGLGAELTVKKIDDDIPEEVRPFALRRILCRNVAENIARKNHVDVGDVEHAMMNLYLSETERLEKSLTR